MKCSTAVFAYPFWLPMNWTPADALNRLSEVNVYFIDLTKRLNAVTRGRNRICFSEPSTYMVWCPAQRAASVDVAPWASLWALQNMENQRSKLVKQQIVLVTNRWYKNIRFLCLIINYWTSIWDLGEKFGKLHSTIAGRQLVSNKSKTTKIINYRTIRGEWRSSIGIP